MPIVERTIPDHFPVVLWAHKESLASDASNEARELGQALDQLNDKEMLIMEAGTDALTGILNIWALPKEVVDVAGMPPYFTLADIVERMASDLAMQLREIGEKEK